MMARYFTSCSLSRGTAGLAMLSLSLSLDTLNGDKNLITLPRENKLVRD